MKDLQLIAEAMKKEEHLVIVGHAVPDGDCVGSVLGLFLGLQQLGKTVEAYLPDKVPDQYHYLHCSEQIRIPEGPIAQGISVVFVDCGDEQRVGEAFLSLMADHGVIFNLDHHRGNPQFGNYNYVDVEAAATAEIIYLLLLALQVTITPGIAQALFAGIVMDTGNFLNGNTTARSLRIAADLMDAGVDIDLSRICLFESKPKAEVVLIARALDNLVISPDGTMAWISLPYDEMVEIGALELFPETLINYTRMIDGVEVGMLFREIKPGTVKVGFRSKGKVDVASLASQFGGGGHLQAAGARQDGSLSEVIERVLKAVKDVMA